MDLVFPLKPHYFHSQIHNQQPLISSSPSYSIIQFQASRRSFKPLFAVKHTKVLSELNSKVNGVLSGDSDPRFLDRVCFKLSHLHVLLYIYIYI